MSEKVFRLVTGIVGAVSTAAIAIVNFIDCGYSTAIVAGIGIVDTAIIEVLTLFKKKEIEEK